MSRGPGKIERAIEDLFASRPSDAYTAEDIADHVFPGLHRVEKKHRVSIIRAARNVCRRLDGWECAFGEGAGRPAIFWTQYDLQSYGMMRRKSDLFAHYRSNDERITETTGRNAALNNGSALRPLATAIDDGSDHDRTLAPAG